MRYFVDTNIFLRTLVKEDKKSFSECVAFLRAVKENKIEAYTGSLILAELVWTLSSYYKLRKEETVRGLRSILHLRGLEIVDDYDHLCALDLYAKRKTKYIDAVIASSQEVRDRKTSVVSYDKDFDKLGVLRQEPREITPDYT